MIRDSQLTANRTKKTLPKDRVNTLFSVGGDYEKQRGKMAAVWFWMSLNPTRQICVAHAHLLSISADTVIIFNLSQTSSRSNQRPRSKVHRNIICKSLAYGVQAHPGIVIEDTAGTQTPDDRCL